MFYHYYYKKNYYYMDKNDYQFLYNYLKENMYPCNFNKAKKGQLRKRAKNFCIKNGVIFSISFKKHRRVVIKKDVEKILLLLHDNQMSGHLGIQKTYSKVSDSYYWPNMFSDVKNYVMSCEKCQKVSQNIKKEKKLIPIKVNNFFERVGIDLVGPLMTTELGNEYIMVVTEYASKFAQAFPIPNKTAECVSKMLFDNFLCIFGNFKYLQSDQGTEFCNKILKNILIEFKITHSKSAPYHPQTNGLTERMNQTLCRSLKKYANEEHNDWDLYLKSITFAYNTSKQSSSKYTPFFLMFGRDALLSVFWKYPSYNYMRNDDIEANFEENYKLLSGVRKNVLKNIKTAQKMQKNQYDAKIKSTEDYKINDLVFYRKKRNIKSGKLENTFNEIYKIHFKYSSGKYKLKNAVTGIMIPNTADASEIKKYYSRDKLKMRILLKFHYTYNCLKPGNWISNFVCDDFCKVIFKEEIKYNQYISTVEINLLLNSEICEIEIYAENIYMCVLDKNHWVGVKYNVRSMVCQIYDPLFTKNYERMVTHIFLKMKFKISEIKYIQFAKQTDAYNCGVYVLGWIFNDICGFESNEFEVDEFRKEIQRFLY